MADWTATPGPAYSRQRRNAVRAGLAKIEAAKLSEEDQRAVHADAEGGAADRRVGGPRRGRALRRCVAARPRAIPRSASRSLPASTSTATTSNSKARGTRASRRFDLLAQINEPGRRKALFMALRPLWRTINADGAAGSPYRRLIGMAAAEARQHGSEIDAAARTMGVSSTSVEEWLTRILDAWRVASGDDPIEPWDYRYAGGGAERALGDAHPPRGAAAPERALLRGPGRGARVHGHALRPRAAPRQGAVSPMPIS